MTGQSIELQATGSAAEPNTYPWERAYFELFERAALLDIEETAMSTPTMLFPLYNHIGKQVSYVNGETAFNQNLHSEEWRFSKSNGVAVQLSLTGAIKNAGWELLERDRVLRFWYSKRAPRLIPDWQTMIAKEVYDQYEINAYAFQEADDIENEIWVVGVFGFPKVDSELPFVMGLGAGGNQELALNKAISETYQRLAFLWGEQKAETLPEAKPAPDFHLEYYHSPASWLYIQDWLNGSLDSHLLDFPPTLWSDIFFVHSELSGQASQVYIVKAISSTNIPLTFGVSNPKISFPLVGQAAVHPIA